MKTYRITRTLTQKDYPWLSATIPAGTLVYAYFGASYGCVSDTGVAVTQQEGQPPFFEVPRTAVEELSPENAELEVVRLRLTTLSDKQQLLFYEFLGPALLEGLVVGISRLAPTPESEGRLHALRTSLSETIDVVEQVVFPTPTVRTTVTEADVEVALQEIRKYADADPERARGDQESLYEDVLYTIASGTVCGTAATRLAGRAAQAGDIDYRW